ncbi:YlmC/YmxH family sporulation protein [Clostridium aestuarii]
MERYEIININNGEKYNYLSDNDTIIDKDGNLKLLIINNTTKHHFSFFGSDVFWEVPWEYVNKIGTRTIILDIEESELKNFSK